jgi:DME family drug/metabolite transporter
VEEMDLSSEVGSRPAGGGGQWFVLAAAVLWGTTGTAQAFAPTEAQPAAVGALRLAIGGVALLILASARGVLRSGGRWPVVATALAAGSMAAYQLCFFAAVARTGVAVGTIVAIGSAPILAGLLGLGVRGERPGRRWAAATVLAVVGCGLLIRPGGDVSVDAGGVVLALGAGVAYATYAVTGKGLLEDRSPDAVMAVVFCLGALFLSPLLLMADLKWMTAPRGLAVALHLGLIATATSYTLFARGLRVVPVATAVTLSLAEPLTAATLGLVVLGERLTGSALLGVGLLFSGLALLSLGAGRGSHPMPGKPPINPRGKS